MDWYNYIFLGAAVAQLLSLINTYRNYRYALTKEQRRPIAYASNTILVVPCKGLDDNFQRNIESFYALDFEPYSLWFVVEDESDPAYAELQRIRETLEAKTQAKEVRIRVAGHTRSCSQKLHNLLYCYRRVPKETEVIAFADSDICVHPFWLSRLVWPLRKARIGVSTGYRWFVPIRNNFASLALSAMNARVALLLGNTRFSQAWGGSMAIRTEIFRNIGLERIWQTAVSDDLSLSYAVRKARLKIAFVPSCLVASYVSTNWRDLIEFTRRQFLITRVCTPLTWSFGLLANLLSVLGLWGAIAFSIQAAVTETSESLPGPAISNLHFAPAIVVFLLLCQVCQAVLRQRLIWQLMPQERTRMNRTKWADLVGFWLWSLLMLGAILLSAVGRTIRWRGIRYRLISPIKTVVLDERPVRDSKARGLFDEATPDQRGTKKTGHPV
ncbi:MAG: glycosyltransferase family 2 protein [Planctomycetes bacterium]|nr:glycosyltransferase family 2 protein [Planctomycetota bacterium]